MFSNLKLTFDGGQIACGVVVGFVIVGIISPWWLIGCAAFLLEAENG